MNKNSLWYVLCGLSLKIALVSAVNISQVTEDQNEIGSPQTVSVEKFSSRVQIGANYSHVHIQPQGTPSFKGSLGGMQLIYEYRPSNSIYAGVKGAWKEGSTQGSTGKRTLLYTDAQERLGYTMTSKAEDYFLTLFTGLGYRHLGQKFTAKVGDVLYFRYNELYVPVGLISDYTVNSWFSIGLGFTWMPQVYPTVSIIPLKGARWILTNTLSNFFVELPLDFTLIKNKKCHMIINPFYEHWKDGHSTAVTSTGIPLGLPGNSYTFWGVDVNFSYSF